MSITNLTQITRSEGDPRVLQTGPSSLTGADELARALGWLSVGLGVTELLAAGQIARALGLEGKEALIRGYGVRELASAVPTLSVSKSVGLAARIAGDALDLATLSEALNPDNPKRGNAALATALIVGITILDIVAYGGTKVVHRRRAGGTRDYSNRSGLPRGPQASRGLARKDFEIPPDYRAEGTVAAANPV
jgi:hypothetical protein